MSSPSFLDDASKAVVLPLPQLLQQKQLQQQKQEHSGHCTPRDAAGGRGDPGKKGREGLTLLLDWDRSYLAPMKYCVRFEEKSLDPDTASWVLSEHCS